MPVKVENRGGKHRIVESNTGRLAMRKGSPVDGGGHASRDRAMKQMRAINHRFEFDKPRKITGQPDKKMGPRKKDRTAFTSKRG